MIDYLELMNFKVVKTDEPEEIEIRPDEQRLWDLVFGLNFRGDRINAERLADEAILHRRRRLTKQMKKGPYR